METYIEFESMLRESSINASLPLDPALCQKVTFYAWSECDETFMPHGFRARCDVRAFVHPNPTRGWECDDFIFVWFPFHPQTHSRSSPTGNIPKIVGGGDFLVG